jgi:hypothetical protein
MDDCISDKAESVMLATMHCGAQLNHFGEFRPTQLSLLWNMTGSCRAYVTKQLSCCSFDLLSPLQAGNVEVNGAAAL